MRFHFRWSFFSSSFSFIVEFDTLIVFPHSLDLEICDNQLISVAMDDTIRSTPLESLQYTPGVKLPSQPIGGLAVSNGFVIVACREHIVTYQGGKVLIFCYSYYLTSFFIEYLSTIFPLWLLSFSYLLCTSDYFTSILNWISTFFRGHYFHFAWFYYSFC